LIDWQPTQISTVRSMNQDLLLRNAVSTVRTLSCVAFVALDALREGYEVYPVVDAIGGTSLEAHRAGLERTVQAGAEPISWFHLPASCSATGLLRQQFPRSSRSS
jgi:nicotinamidase-related amidase